MPRISLPTLAGGIPVPRVTSQLCFLPQGPAWGSKDKCFTKMYTTSGECCKACNLGEGVVQPCGVNQTVCEPCLDSEYLLPPPPRVLGTGGALGTTSRRRGPPCVHPLGRAAWMHFVLLAAASRCPIPAQMHPNGRISSRISPQSFSHLPSKSQPQIQQPPCSRTCWCQARLQVPFQGSVPQLPPSTALQNSPTPRSPSEPPVPLLILPCKGCKIKLGEGEANHTGS